MRNDSQTSSRRLATALALVAANLIPLVGVLAFGWDVASLLFIYWLESAVVGFFNVLRMAQAEGTLVDVPRGAGSSAESESQASARGPGDSQTRPATFFGLSAESRRQLASAPKLVLIPFFLLHYGLFMAGHLVFLLALFGPPRIPALDLGLTASAFFASHGFSYVTFYLLGGESRHASPASEMQRPYGRIVVMHLTILLGAFLVTRWGSPTVALVVMVGVKILIDLLTHTRLHARRSLAWTTST